MSNTPKIRVAVLYGGRSGEHEVSLQSAAAVIKNLDPSRFEVIPIGIDKEGHWLLGDMQQLEFDGKTLLLPHVDQKITLPPHPESKAVMTVGGQSMGQVDVVFPVLHGTNGEDGTVQGLLDLAEMAYVGPGVLGSAIGMDKDVAKRLALSAGVNIPPFIAVKLGEWAGHRARIEALVEQLNYPVFIKPCNAGSSLGINKVKSRADLQQAVEEAFLYDTKILIEKAVNAREVELAVLENSQYGEAPLVSQPGEVIPHHEFYSYDAKYMDPNGASLAIPAPLSPEQTQKAQDIARTIFAALEIEGMARVDLFLDKDSGEFYFNEVNTIPGFTQISLYPKLWEASGLPYQQLLTRLVELAMARQIRRKKLKREKAA